MKYFVDSKAREASCHENYLEFQLPTATEEFWDKTSLYLSNELLRKTGFGEFWCDCMREDIVFDMSTISKDDLMHLETAALECGGEIPEVIYELKAWADSHLDVEEQVIGVNWESDRALARRRAQREAYPIDPRFTEEAREMYERYKDVPLTERIAVTEEAYEDLLRKYNMPKCFFPFEICNPDTWDE